MIETKLPFTTFINPYFAVKNLLQTLSLEVTAFKKLSPLLVLLQNLG